MKTAKNADKSYHHGNLREALIDAAMDAVRNDGVSTFSLRDAARQAGVTPGAVYKHFDSKGALLAAVAVLGFENLRKRVASVLSQVSDKQRLRSVGLVYVDFAVEEPRLFGLMFGPYGPGGPRDSIESPRGGIFDALKSAIAVVQGISMEDVSPSDIALAWATAHGAARLVTDGQWKRDDPRIRMSIDAAVKAIGSKDEQLRTKR